MMHLKINITLTIFFLLLVTSVTAQQLNKAKFEEIKKRISFQGTEIITDDLIFNSYSFEKVDVLLEAVMVRPRSKMDEKLPSIVILPNHNKSAIDYLARAVKWSKLGFAVITVSLPGVGRSNGKPDFNGNNTLRSLRILFDKLQRDPRIDNEKINIYGYSRGAMAASLLITNDIKVCSAVLVSGIYDLQNLFDFTNDQNMRYNILLEAGTIKRNNTRELNLRAATIRSSILKMKKLNSNLLIIHGRNDKIVPINQAESLKEVLDKYSKNFEVKIYEDKGHVLGKEHQVEATNFFTLNCK